MNLFNDLYRPDKQGAWMSDHQGLHAGMDLHDWKQFIHRACSVIAMDENPERRLFKAWRLRAKATKTAGCWGVDTFIARRIGGLIASAEYGIANRVNVRLVQLSLWEAQQ